MIETSRATKQPKPLLVRRIPDELPAMQKGWAEFEELVGLRGRKFYGLVDVAANEYILATVPRADDPPDAWGLEPFELPGGAYLCTELRGEPPELYSRIGPAMQELEAQSEVDKSRYLVEFYRRHDEIELWVPVA